MAVAVSLYLSLVSAYWNVISLAWITTPWHSQYFYIYIYIYIPPNSSLLRITFAYCTEWCDCTSKGLNYFNFIHLYMLFEGNTIYDNHIDTLK